MVLGFLAVDNFDITRKIAIKKFGWKTRENVGVLSKLNGPKFDFSNSVSQWMQTKIQNLNKKSLQIIFFFFFKTIIKNCFRKKLLWFGMYPQKKR